MARLQDNAEGFPRPFSCIFLLTYELISTTKRVYMRPKHTTLTPQELEIMKVIWKLGTPTVRQVYENLLERRKVLFAVWTAPVCC